MKVWYGYGSEHSANLVMIGRFIDAADAAKTEQVIEQLTEQVSDDVKAKLMEIGFLADRFTDNLLKLLGEVRVHSLGPAELEQFAYDVNVKRENNQLVITTDEIDVSAFLKVLVDKGARVEVYSAHDYPDTDYGRGK
ncbi:MAG: hypothetical protein KJ650_07410 [Firmicutes bacterium]|nr:hypothetical protein [Bacillota bacterium]MBV1727857.1 hypothetical protein [Desulforudis sp.]MBU4533436.1 hypothetical protein [Bacillota bacterium]MBU4554332.1 hypothetical protein [Bacillota bacterium]MBV1735299.1 hypothetical protein [Desulforudis sp.]